MLSCVRLPFLHVDRCVLATNVIEALILWGGNSTR
jgi:hypothetical protein